MIDFLDFYQAGTLVFIYGCMFCGKTEGLIRLVIEAQSKGLKVIAFKHAFDKRYDNGACLTSHSKLSCEAIAESDPLEILSRVTSETQIVVIDEVQFFDESIIEVVRSLTESGRCVYLAGLNTDFRGFPFGQFEALYSLSHKHFQLFGVCAKCGREATRTQRLTEDGLPVSFFADVVQVGANEIYEPRCENCHIVTIVPNQWAT